MAIGAGGAAGPGALQRSLPENASTARRGASRLGAAAGASVDQGPATTLQRHGSAEIPATGAPGRSLTAEPAFRRRARQVVLRLPQRRGPLLLRADSAGSCPCITPVRGSRPT